AAMTAPDPRDPWWVPAPLEGPAAPRRAALCLNPDGMETEPAVVKALQDAARRLSEAGWSVDTVDALPPLREAADLQIRMWMADGYEGMVEAARKEGDRGALTALEGQREHVAGMDLAKFSAVLTRRATLTRLWELFLADYPVLLLPVSAELPFADNLDLQGEAAYRRVWRAQMTQIGLPFMGLPGLTVAMGSAGGSPVGVQVVAGRYREDLCLAAGEVIEAAGPAVEVAEPVAR
ncbi:amidase family protein, partial [Achromobacter insuavis]|uniref:amidase family protein n=1 Tax=Achromobacter insuavis TaxID=1287735 RepID=UPI0035A05E0D